METAGQWLEKALVELCAKIETGLGLGLDEEIIKGLVSYCDLAQPRDAKEYLDVTLATLFYFFLFLL
jgi:activating signal cointegrator 1